MHLLSLGRNKDEPRNHFLGRFPPKWRLLHGDRNDGGSSGGFLTIEYALSLTVIRRDQNVKLGPERKTSPVASHRGEGSRSLLRIDASESVEGAARPQAWLPDAQSSRPPDAFEGSPQYELDGNLGAEAPKSPLSPTCRPYEMRSHDPTQRKMARIIHPLIHHTH